MPEGTEKTIPVHVALRIRPLLPKELGEGCQECIEVTPGEPQVVMGNNKAFTYDYVYGTAARQSELYDQTVIPLLNRFFKGYNATLLAYGQTGSGKTYSMGTGFTMCTNREDIELQGVIPRVILDLFSHMESKKDETEFLLKVSFLEIHNEEIHDLLNPSSSSDKIAIREQVDGGIKIAGLLELPVTSGEDMVKALCNGSASRATGSTAMNSTSSRSHAIFSIIMEQKDKAGEGDIRRAKFHLVDLAGSERCKRTNAQGERFKEGVNINKGLLALGNVISALSDEQRKSNAHVPYRDSKLTRLLQDSLGGNSNTVMLACVSPADSNYEETLNTLRYADRARQIKNKPIVNRDPVSAEMARLKQQVQMLQLQLLQGQTINGSLPDAMGNNVGLNWHELTERVRQLEEENRKLSEELHNSVDQNTKMFEKVLMAELSRDKLIRKYEELKQYITEHEIKLNPSLEENKDGDQDFDLAAELQKKFHHFEESCAAASKTIEDDNDCKESPKHDHSYEVEHMDQDNSSLPSSPMNSTFESQHALRQAELGRQVQELTKALAMKQELALKMQENEGAMSEKMVKQYEVTVRDLESEISKLEKEKSDLALALAAVKSSTNSEGSSKDRNRVKELEAKIVELKKKQVELQKLQRLKTQSDSTITKLNNEIQSMKSIRVKLMKQMKEESERFRTLKKEKEKEIMQLKQQDRKRQFEYSKLQNIHQKQQAVLKRKTEEAAAANKRLHDALCKRKEAADKRDNNKSLQNKQSEGLIPRMKSWLTHEVEVLVSVSLAKKTLEELIDDRKTISHQISELRGKIQEDEQQPPKKKKLSMNGTDPEERDSAENDELQTRLKALETELKIKTSQIAELQRKLLDADCHISGEKSKHRWNNIHTMAEAKAGLQVLLTMSVEAKSEQIKIEKEIEDHKKELEGLRIDSAEWTKKHRSQLDCLRKDYDVRVTTLQKEHEDKVLLLLQQIPSEEEKANVKRLREIIQLKESELAEKQRETDILQQRFCTLTEAINNESAIDDAKSSTVICPQTSEIMVVEDIEIQTPLDAEEDDCVLVKEEIADYTEEDEEDEDETDDLSKDPNWVKTPRVRNLRKSNEVANNNNNKGCSCKGKCMTQACKCKKGKFKCASNCGCLESKCQNRPRDPTTPMRFNSSFESELSTSDESPLKLKAKKQKRVSNTERKALTNSNNTLGSVKSKLFHAGGRENKTPSSRLTDVKKTPFKKVSSPSTTDKEKARKLRRKSSLLSKKPGVKDATSRFLVSSHRTVLRTPGSGFTPPKTPAPQVKHKNNTFKNNKKTINVDSKQRKRKLHNPTALSGMP